MKMAPTKSKKSDDWVEHFLAARNRMTSDDTLLTLAVEDSDDEVSACALRNLHERIERGEEESEQTRVAVALIEEAAADGLVFDCRTALDMAVARAGDGSDPIWTLCLLTAFAMSKKQRDKERDDD